MQCQLEPLLRQHPGHQTRNRYGRRVAANLLKIRPALPTFSKRPGVTPTNHHAERALRGAVIYQSSRLGTQSTDGDRRIERPLSAHTTCRLQRRSLHAYLIDLSGAHARGDPAPLLT